MVHVNIAQIWHILSFWPYPGKIMSAYDKEVMDVLNVVLDHLHILPASVLLTF